MLSWVSFCLLSEAQAVINSSYLFCCSFLFLRNSHMKMLQCSSAFCRNLSVFFTFSTFSVVCFRLRIFITCQTRETSFLFVSSASNWTKKIKLNFESQTAVLPPAEVLFDAFVGRLICQTDSFFSLFWSHVKILFSGFFSLKIEIQFAFGFLFCSVKLFIFPPQHEQNISDCWSCRIKSGKCSILGQEMLLETR